MKKDVKTDLDNTKKQLKMLSGRIIDLDLLSENEVRTIRRSYTKSSKNMSRRSRVRGCYRTLDGNPKFKGYKVNRLFN